MDIKYYKNNPTTFIQDHLEINLLPHQKMIFNKIYNAKNHYYFIPARQCGFEYIRLFLILMNLEDGSNITIMSPNGSKGVTKEQFIKAWMDAYYKVGDKNETH